MCPSLGMRIRRQVALARPGKTTGYGTPSLWRAGAAALCMRLRMKRPLVHSVLWETVPKNGLLARPVASKREVVVAPPHGRGGAYRVVGARQGVEGAPSVPLASIRGDGGAAPTARPEELVNML